MVKNKANTVEADKSNAGFRLEIFNFFIVLFTVVITVALCSVIFMSHRTYNAFYDATEQYIVCRQSAENVHEASDYLTREVRAFAEEGKLEHMNNYFNEANTAKRRENSIATIKKYDSDNTKNGYLEKAKDFSFELMSIEYYSMRLVLEADGVPEEKYPDVIKHTTLKDADKQLSNEEKRSLAK